MTEPKEIPPKELVAIMDAAIVKFKGDGRVLEGALGALVFGRRIGWRPLFLLHSNSTIKKYENILGISFREVLQPIGINANKSIAWTGVLKLGNFWKAVTGNTKNVRSSDIS